jgi:mersacidin/lichenicidin family type 2 lantibiotic
MSSAKLIRAWKDEEYRLSLSEAERALLPENPAGSIELTDAELELAAGAGPKNQSWHRFKHCFFSLLFCGASCDFTVFACNASCNFSACGGSCGGTA